jgi:hypothetical protein
MALLNIASRSHRGLPLLVRRKMALQNAAVTQKEIRVGFVGADTKASWAKVSHIPALNGLAGVKLAAVATRNEQSARQAAETFGADR